MNSPLDVLADIAKRLKPDLAFTLLEVGALQLEDSAEPFYQLLPLFPGSKVIGFEIEEETCAQMNAKARPGVHYYPYALGERNETRTLYITQHPMCCSLYKPNEPFIDLYNHLYTAKLERTTEVETISLDYFMDQQNVGTLDFIKIDVQGAELDVFKGGIKALADVLAIICEVEFVPIYVDQPLFGDVCTFLGQHDFMFHNFLGLAGRTVKPIITNGNPNDGPQKFWSDAVYIRHIQKFDALSDESLLKMALITCVYGSVDLSYHCLAHLDQRHATQLAPEWLQRVKG